MAFHVDFQHDPSSLAVPGLRGFEPFTMSSEQESAPHSANRNGLPPVSPPSFRFVGQLFLVPGLIVAVLVLLAVWFMHSRPTAASLLADLRSTNADERWRAAEKLSQMLPRDRAEENPTLAADVPLSLELADMLHKALAEEERLVKQIAGRSESEAAKETKELEEQQQMIRFLVVSLGDFLIPVGAPNLCRVATTDSGPKPRILHERRHLAILSLKNLAACREDFHRLPEERQLAILEELKGIASHSDDRGGWAKAALEYLADDKPLGVESALVKCGKSEDPLVREASALALGFWPGEAGEKALLYLLRDDGHGANPDLDKDNEKEKAPISQEDLQARYRLEIRYHALLSLARRGSKEIGSWLKDFAVMLDEDQQLKNFQITKDGQTVPDRGAAILTVRNALSVLPLLHEKRPDLDLSVLDPALTKLTDSSNLTLKGTAEKTRKILGFTQ